MKRMSGVIYAALIILIIPFSMVAGQDKKSEQKIKIIVDDGSGTKVIIDTVFKDSSGPDSIRLKDGNVIYLKHSGDEIDIKHHDGKKHITITASTDRKEEGTEVEEVTIISSDSLHLKKAGDRGNVMFYSNSDDGRSRGKYKVITRSSGELGDKGEIIYINKGKAPDKETEKTFDFYVPDNNNDSTVEKTRYVIAKDGIVVTIEGSDKTKAKELAKEIENKLGVKSEGTDKKETVKVESKKTIKK
jgi:hypothetical protein